jgi:asparagine N-glycosylation enzyme membrane subunit Stt3
VLEAALFFVGALLLFRWQLGRWDGYHDFDGHFHFRVAEWIAHFGWWTDLPWLPFTVLGERGPDHQWLWHLTLVPYTWFGSSEEVLAWATAVNGALVPAALAFVARMLRVPAAPVFVILAVTAGTLMPFRLLMLRSQNIAIIYMALVLWAIARGHYRTLLLLAFLFMQSYHAGVILVPIALLGCAAHSFLQRRPVISPLLAVAGGLALALLISPWFPRNIEFLLFHTLYKTEFPLHGEQLSGLIGSEWYPAPLRVLLLDSWPAHLLLLAALVAVGLRWRREPAWRPSAETLLAIGIAGLSLGLYWKAIRFAEYYVPFSAIAAGLAARDAWPSLRLNRAKLAALAAAAIVFASVGVAGLATPARLPRDYMETIGAKLNELGKPGDIVFNSSWNDFAALVWWADAFSYINGLDGHFLAYGDPARFIVWLSVSLGYLEDPSAIIATGFGARFVVVAREHGNLARQLQASRSAVLQLATRDGWLFEIKR